MLQGSVSVFEYKPQDTSKFPNIFHVDNGVILRGSAWTKSKLYLPKTILQRLALSIQIPGLTWNYWWFNPGNIWAH